MTLFPEFFVVDKESNELDGVRVSFDNLSFLSLLDVNHVLVGNVNTQCIDSWVLLADVERKEPPACFACSKETKVLAFFYLVPWTSTVLGVDPLNTNHGSIASLVDILEEVYLAASAEQHTSQLICASYLGVEKGLYGTTHLLLMTWPLCMSDTTSTMIRRATTVGRIYFIWLPLLCVA